MRRHVRHVVLPASLAQPVQDDLILRTRGLFAIPDCARSDLDVVLLENAKKRAIKRLGHHLKEDAA